MNVIFTIAPWSHKETLPKSMAARSFLNRKFAMTNSLNYPCGILYMCATLREAGHSPRLVDGYHYTDEQIIDEIARDKAKLVGLSCIQFGWPHSKRLMAKIRKRLPDVKIAVGGYYINYWREKALEDCEDVDFAIVGEGEFAICKLCEALEGRGRLEDVDGLAWRKNGQIVKNRPKPIADLDTIPFPDYSQIKFEDYSPAIGSYKALPSAMLFGSRGCANHCTFCLSDKNVRYRSAENVVDEIEWLQNEHGVRHVQFFDETFTLARDRALDFLGQLDKRDVRIPWTANARADTVDMELLRAMKKGGCWRIHVGGESAIQKNLDILRKGITPDQVRKSVGMIRKAGMEAYASFIIGIPGETYEEALETIRFACSLPLDYANFHNLTPCEGSEIDRHLDEHGRIVGPRAFHQITFVPHTMTVEEVGELLTLAHKKFYMRPKFLVKKFLAQRSLEDVRRNLRGFLAYSRLKAEDHYEAVVTTH